MMHEIRQVARIQNAMNCNLFLYWLKKVPVVKRLFPDGIYGENPLKGIVAHVSRIFFWLFGFIGKFFYLFVACGLPQLAIYGLSMLSKGWPLFVSTLFFLSFFAGCFLQSDILAPTLIKYTCVRQMGMASRPCIAATTGKLHATMFVTFTPALMTAALIYGQPAWVGLVLSAELACVRLVAEWLLLQLYDKEAIVLNAKMLYLVLVIVLSMAGAYIPLVTEVVIPLDLVLLHPAVAGILLLLGGLSGRWLWRYPRYHSLLIDRCKADTVMAATDKAKIQEAAFQDVKLRDSDLEPSCRDEALMRYHGYKYLNALFFMRHRRMLKSPLWWELGLVGALFLAGLVGVLLFPDKGALLLAKLPQSLPYFVFIMYFVCNSMGTRICKAMFYNCDIALLRYSWYRDKNVVLKNFSVRLGHIAAINLTLGGAICLALAVLVKVSGAVPPMLELIPFFLGILCLSVFFSVHPLFLYYVFQPYTTQLAVKNPFFRGLNLVVYLVCWGSIYIKQPPAGFTVIVLAATLLYCTVALLLVWRYSPKSFRVK